MWHKKQQQQQNVLKEFSPVFGHSYNAAWIQRLEFGWDLLLKESVDIKCTMYDQHVEVYYTV